MSSISIRTRQCGVAAALVVISFPFAPGILPGSTARAASLNIADSPLFLSAAAEPLVMLALSNDEQLYHKAYTDFDDLDGDGSTDSSYKDSIAYYGYFDSAKCYDYTGTAADGYFFPRAATPSADNHYCDTVSNGRWSGNFLNWASMSRMDTLRKVLYGGYRSTDNATTILERVYIPSDNHAWTKLYAGSDLNKYTPYSFSTYPNGITFCNVTPQGSSTNRSETNVTTPRLRIANGAFTEWAAQENRQCLWTSEFTPVDAGASPVDTGASPAKIAEFTARVKVCDSALLGEETCKLYGTTYKPVGLLQDFADADKLKMRFGLMTGSYGKRKSGGVLRKNTARMTDEISATDGTFTGADGIVKALNLMRISRYEYSAPGYGAASPGDNCPFNQNTWSNGACSNWGSPVGEMYLEALRYFAGKTPNTNFLSTDNAWINGLKEASWANPYTSTDTTLNPGGKAPYCAKPSIIAIATGVLSFDNDEFGSAASDIGIDVNAETNAVGVSEKIHGKNWYVGSITGGSPTDECKTETVTALSAVTGICPQSAGLQGSFKMVGLAAYAHKKTTALQTIDGNKIKPVDTFAVALAPPTPTIAVKVGERTVTIIPAGYNARNSNAMQLVNFRVISESANGKQGTYFMNYENAPSGSDYDNDMKGVLTYSVNGPGDTIKIIMHQTGSSAGATQKMGYIIDGVSDAGTFYLLSNNNLLVAGQQGGATFSTLTTSAINTACSNAGFAADPSSVDSELCNYVQAGVAAPGRAYMRGVKSHTIGTPGTSVLESPLFYAAKWGGYQDLNNDGSLQNSDGSLQTEEWDSNLPEGVPDTYFPVTNAGTLGAQLTKAFNEIDERNASAAAASVNSGSISSESRVYQARFNSSTWTGELIAYAVDQTTGQLVSTPEWTAGPQTGANANPLPAPGLRDIITLNSGGAKVAFTWNGLDATRKQQLDDATVAPFDATLQEDRLDYLRGDAGNEGAGSGDFRRRPSKLGDIVNSSPLFIGAPAFNHRDSLESKPYSKFRSDNADRQGVLYVGANDGMLHAFNADTGDEMLAFIPGAVFPNLKQLTKQNYSHLFYVDGAPNMGDVFFDNEWHTVVAGGLNKGGKGIYALDVTDPGDFSEGHAGSLILWEFTDTKAAPYGDADLGYTYSQPAIVRLHNDRWAAVFGNGYNNAGSGHAVLYIVDMETGERIAKLDTHRGSTATPNGLSTPAAVDLNGDGLADYVYAGDLLGNLWKFDIANASPTNWKVAHGTTGAPLPLFTALDASNNPQPIVSRPEVGRGPNGAGMIVLFGTGKFLETADRTVTSSPASSQRVQTFYGIIDVNTGAASDIVPGRTDAASGTAILQQQKILYEQAQEFRGVTVNVRVPSNEPRGTARGWYLDLVQPAWYADTDDGYQGERVVSNPILRNDRVIFTTLIPNSDTCGFGGTSWLMELDALSGARLKLDPFDLTRDGVFGSEDRLDVTVSGTAEELIVGGVQSTVGITAEAGILTSPKAEYKYKFGTMGTGEVTIENPGANTYGRQSWRQIR